MSTICRAAILLAAGAAGLRPAHADSYGILVVEEMLGRVTILASDHPQQRISIPVGFKPHEIVVTPDGGTAYVSNFGLNDAENRDGKPGNTISVIDIKGARVRTDLRLPGALQAPHGLGLRPPRAEKLFVNAEQGDQMVVYDVQSGRIDRTFALPPGVHNFVFSDDGAILFAFASAGTVFRLDPDSGVVNRSRSFGAPVRGLAWTHDGRHLIAAVKGKIVLLDPAELSTTKEFSLAGGQQPFYCAASPDDQRIFAPSVFDGTVTVLSSVDGAVIRTVHTGTPLRVVLSPDPDLAYVANVSPKGDRLTVLHLRTLETQDIAGVHDANGLSFSWVIPDVLKAPVH